MADDEGWEARMSARPDEDRQAIACNYTVGTHVAAAGALAYVIPSHLGGNLPERLRLLVRSRSGRWVDKWESTARLANFRVKTIPPGHPRYADERVAVGDRAEALRRCQDVERVVRRG